VLNTHEENETNHIMASIGSLLEFGRQEQSVHAYIQNQRELAICLCLSIKQCGVCCPDNSKLKQLRMQITILNQVVDESSVSIEFVARKNFYTVHSSVLSTK